MGVKSQETALLQQEKENMFAELKESRVEVSRATQTKDTLKREMTRLKTSHAKELDKLHKRLKGRGGIRERERKKESRERERGGSGGVVKEMKIFKSKYKADQEKRMLRRQ